MAISFTIKWFLSDLDMTLEAIERLSTLDTELNIELDKFLKGSVFQQGEEYTPNEIDQILKDTKTVVKQHFNQATADERKYVTVAGAPGTGKSHFLSNTLKKDHYHSVVINPNEIGLNALSGYKKDLREKGPEAAYNKWRNASNFVANLMLLKAITEGKGILHDQTAQSDRTKKLFDILKENEYSIEMHILFANEFQRAAALAHRSQDSIMCTEKDAKAKARTIYRRMLDTYFVKPDTVRLHTQENEYWIGKGTATCFAAFDQFGRTLKTVHETLFAKWFDLVQEDLRDDTFDFNAQLRALGIKIPYLEEKSSSPLAGSMGDWLGEPVAREPVSTETLELN